MKKLLLPILIVLTINTFAQHHSILIDTHNDVLSNELINHEDIGVLQSTGNFDLVRAKQGGQDGQVFSIWCGPQYGKGTAFKFANREIDSLYALLNRYPNKIILVRNSAQLKQAVAEHKFAALIGVEGGHMIEDRMDYIDSLHKRGLCYLTLTWNNSTSWATSAYDERFHHDSLKFHGLTDYGRKIVHHLNDLGVMIDLSHPSEQTLYDVLAITNKPVIASHSCAYALNPHQRNLKDEELKAIAKNGGVVFVNFYSGFVDSTYAKKASIFRHKHRAELDSLIKIYNDEDLATDRLYAIYKSESDFMRPPLSMLIKHIDYIAKLIGTDHVGIGSDFDGAESYPLGMDDVRDYPKIAVELRKLGYTQTDIDKIFGENFIRVLKANTGK